MDPQGSAALVGGAEAAVVYLRVADAQSAIPDGAKEALVSLLDLAEQHFRAGAVIIAFEKTRAESSSAFSLFPPPPNRNHHPVHAARGGSVLLVRVVLVVCANSAHSRLESCVMSC